MGRAEMSKTFIAFTSGGNDSVAMLQLLIEEKLPQTDRVIALYTNTGWAAPYWAERIERISSWLSGQGIIHVELQTKGFENLVRTEGNRKGEPPGRFPTGKEKFCTRQLKILPAQQWLNSLDPEGQFICCVGVRRAESERRAHAPAFIPRSENHGGRSCWHPLVEATDETRNVFVSRTPIDLLDHRSDECEPCIFATRADLRRVGDPKVATIKAIEEDTGKTMFRPAAYAGARGMGEIMKWAWSDRGKYKPDEGEEVLQDCESDWCGL
jgi:3'-phosphoadenosine 5'-phosphosulfate sulfotransferase (PAPS reductase)/FAD synthetase